jgi:hypothetical protein
MSGSLMPESFNKIFLQASMVLQLKIEAIQKHFISVKLSLAVKMLYIL